jgi:hypothetical protein
MHCGSRRVCARRKRSRRCKNRQGVRSVPLIVAIPFFSAAVFAGEIREFDLKTVARLGAELARVSQTADRGATTPARKRARDTAIAASKNKLFKAPYEYVVLDDPDGSGFLVYGLPQFKDKIVLGGWLRATVSADGEKAKRIDALSRTLLYPPPPPAGHKGEKPLAVSMSQIVSNKPLETCVYTSLHDKVIVSVGMVNDNAKVWMFIGDKIYEMTPELMKQLGVNDQEKKK